MEPLRPPWIVLKLVVQQRQCLPLLQKIQRLGPWFPLQQPLQLHPQPCCQGRWGIQRSIAMAPGQGPLIHGAANLLSALLSKLETKSSGIASGPDHPGGVVLNAAGMQKPQLTRFQILQTMVEIDQLTGHQIKGHGIDREIAAHEVSLKGSGLNHGILRRGRVVLLPRRRQIQWDSIQLKRHRAEGPMLLNTGDAFGTDLTGQFLHKRSSVSLHHPVQIRNTRPGTAVALMQQLIAHTTANQGQTGDTESSSRSLQRLQNRRRHTWKIHCGACRRMRRSSRIPSLSALTRCLEEEASAIASAAERLSSEQVEAALTLLERCADRKAKLVITGVGKSGIVARKIAATFSSIGLMALFLNPTDALHGDLGVVAAEDVCLLLSNSGETSELLEVLPHLTRRGTGRIAIVGRADSSLARGSDVVLEAGVDREVCPLNLAPTASTAVAMAIGDALAAVWMERRGISPADFALNHPAGSLGKQLTLTAADLMVPASQLHPLQPSTPLPEVIGGLTRDGIGSGWVENPDSPGSLLGILTDGDLRRALQDHGAETWSQLTAKDLMTADPITVNADVLVVKALAQMEHNRRKPISVLPVVNQEHQLMGLLRLHDLVQAGLA